MGNNPSKFKSPQSRNLPVETVSWHDAIEFCRRLSMETGRKFDLPSEAQWEYACRAGSKGAYCFGSDKTLLGKYAWYEENSKGETHAVGTLACNRWGLYDMHGNVWEWCLDSWHPSYEAAPNDGSAWEPDSGPQRLLRGGSLYDSARHCRSANRLPNDLRHRGDNIGFRVLAVPMVNP
jgi:formylglycine-generating enzyme required for sulfatase activity